MVNKTYITSKVIISKVDRDFKPGTADWIGDGMTWIAEAMEHIGTTPMYENRWITEEVEDHRLKIPCELDNFIGIIFNKCKLRLNSGLTKTKDINKVDGYPIDLHNWYSYNPEYFEFSFESGEVEILINGIAVDDDGWPMIPNGIKTKEAITFYLMWKMILSGFKHPLISLEYAEAQWVRFSLQAQAETNSFSLDEASNFAREWGSHFTGVDFMQKVYNRKYSE
jgi:hypothetical protein